MSGKRKFDFDGDDDVTVIDETTKKKPKSDDTKRDDRHIQMPSVIYGENRYDKLLAYDEVVKLIKMDGLDIRKVPVESNMFGSVNVFIASLLYVDCKTLLRDTHGKWKLSETQYIQAWNIIISELKKRYNNLIGGLVVNAYDLDGDNIREQQEFSEEIIIQAQNNDVPLDDNEIWSEANRFSAANENAKRPKYSKLDKRTVELLASIGPYLGGPPRKYEIDLNEIYDFMITSTMLRPVAKACAVLFDTVGVHVAYLWSEWVQEHFHDKPMKKEIEQELRLSPDINDYPDEYLSAPYTKYGDMRNTKYTTSIIGDIYRYSMMKNNITEEKHFDLVNECMDARSNGLSNAISIDMDVFIDEKIAIKYDVQFYLDVTRMSTTESSLVKGRNRIVFYVGGVGSIDDHIGLLKKMIGIYKVASTGKLNDSGSGRRLYPRLVWETPVIPNFLSLGKYEKFLKHWDLTDADLNSSQKKTLEIFKRRFDRESTSSDLFVNEDSDDDNYSPDPYVQGNTVENIRLIKADSTYAMHIFRHIADTYLSSIKYDDDDVNVNVFVKQAIVTDPKTLYKSVKYNRNDFIKESKRVWALFSDALTLDLLDHFMMVISVHRLFTKDTTNYKLESEYKDGLNYWYSKIGSGGGDGGFKNPIKSQSKGFMEFPTSKLHINMLTGYFDAYHGANIMYGGDIESIPEQIYYATNHTDLTGMETLQDATFMPQSSIDRKSSLLPLPIQFKHIAEKQASYIRENVNNIQKSNIKGNVIPDGIFLEDDPILKPLGCLNLSTPVMFLKSKHVSSSEDIKGQYASGEQGALRLQMDFFNSYKKSASTSGTWMGHTLSAADAYLKVHVRNRHDRNANSPVIDFSLKILYMLSYMDVYSHTESAIASPLQHCLTSFFMDTGDTYFKEQLIRIGVNDDMKASNPVLRTLTMGDMFINAAIDNFWTDNERISNIEEMGNTYLESSDTKVSATQQTGFILTQTDTMVHNGKKMNLSDELIHNFYDLQINESKDIGDSATYRDVVIDREKYINKENISAAIRYWNLMELQKRSLFVYRPWDRQHVGMIDHLMFDPMSLVFFMSRHFMNIALTDGTMLKFYRDAVAFGCLLHHENMIMVTNLEEQILSQELLDWKDLDSLAKNYMMNYKKIFPDGIGVHIMNIIKDTSTPTRRFDRIFVDLILQHHGACYDVNKLPSLFHIIRKTRITYGRAKLDNYFIDMMVLPTRRGKSAIISNSDIGNDYIAGLCGLRFDERSESTLTEIQKALLGDIQISEETEPVMKSNNYLQYISGLLDMVNGKFKNVTSTIKKIESMKSMLISLDRSILERVVFFYASKLFSRSHDMSSMIPISMINFINAYDSKPHLINPFDEVGEDGTTPISTDLSHVLFSSQVNVKRRWKTFKDYSSYLQKQFGANYFDISLWPPPRKDNEDFMTIEGEEENNESVDDAVYDLRSYIPLRMYTNITDGYSNLEAFVMMMRFIEYFDGNDDRNLTIEEKFNLPLGWFASQFPDIDVSKFDEETWMILARDDPLSTMAYFLILSGTLRNNVSEVLISKLLLALPVLYQHLVYPNPEIFLELKTLKTELKSNPWKYDLLFMIIAMVNINMRSNSFKVFGTEPEVIWKSLKLDTEGIPTYISEESTEHNIYDYASIRAIFGVGWDFTTHQSISDKEREVFLSSGVFTDDSKNLVKLIDSKVKTENPSTRLHFRCRYIGIIMALYSQEFMKDSDRTKIMASKLKHLLELIEVTGLESRKSEKVIILDENEKLTAYKSHQIIFQGERKEVDPFSINKRMNNLSINVNKFTTSK